MSGVNTARGRARRVLLSALAGGGLTAAGLSGPLSGGALASESPTGVDPPPGTSTAPAPQTPTQTSTTATPTTTTGTTTTTGGPTSAAATPTPPPTSTA